MNGNTDNSSVWGTYAPRGFDRLILLMKNLGLGYGASKKLLGRLWYLRHNDTPIDITYNSLKFRLYPKNNAIEAKMLFGIKRRERRELQAIKEFVSADSVFIDIGANIGYYSLMVTLFGARRVFAIEPNPTVFSRLVFNISANSFNNQIVALPVALGDQSGHANLIIANNDMGGSRISDINTEDKSVSVPIRPLPELLAEEGVDHIDALKIDVEGMEDSVLTPLYANSPTSLWPRVVIIEHINQQKWKTDILTSMLATGYILTGTTRSNSILCLS